MRFWHCYFGYDQQTLTGELSLREVVMDGADTTPTRSCFVAFSLGLRFCGTSAASLRALRSFSAAFIRSRSSDTLVPCLRARRHKIAYVRHVTVTIQRNTAVLTLVHVSEASPRILIRNQHAGPQDSRVGVKGLVE